MGADLGPMLWRLAGLRSRLFETERYVLAGTLRALERQPSMAATNKCLAQSNKSRHARKTTKKHAGDRDSIAAGAAVDATFVKLFIGLMRAAH